jgi:hypothetical protein
MKTLIYAIGITIGIILVVLRRRLQIFFGDLADKLSKRN